MIANLVGTYLLKNGRISQEQYDAYFEEIGKVRVKLGLIAVHEGLMTEYQADTINMLQASMNKRFGDLAVEKGFLTDKQVQELLKKQGDPYLSVAQALENVGIMKLPELDHIMMNYRVENELSASSLEALKSDDIEKILPLFLPMDAEEYMGIATIAVKTIMRLVDTDFLLEKGYYTYQLDSDKAAMQFVDGDPCLTTCFSSLKDGLLHIARTFGKEEFETVDMEALDAVAELINCINGMYASNLSERRIQMELYPPEYDSDIREIGDDEMLVIPMILKGKRVFLSFCIGERLQFIK